jgi:O-antigen ligase
VLDLLAGRIAPEMLIMGATAGGLLVIGAVLRPAICFALGVPALLFLGQLQHVVPVSVSGAAAACALCAVVGSVLRLAYTSGVRKPSLDVSQMLMVAIGILMAFSTRYSLSPTYGVEKAVLYWVLVLPVVVFAPVILGNVRPLHTAVSLICGSLSAYVYASAAVASWEMVGGDRQSALLDVTVAGQYLGLAFVTSLGALAFRPLRIHGMVFHAVTAALAIVLVFRTGTRAAVVSAALMLAFMAWYSYPLWSPIVSKHPQRVLGSLLTAGLITVLATSVTKQYVPSEVMQRFGSTERILSDFIVDGRGGWQRSESRLLNYMVAVESFRSQPLRGLGAGGYKQALERFLPVYAKSRTEGAPVYPHNVLFEFASELGVFGLGLFLCVIAANGVAIMRMRQVLAAEPSRRWIISIPVGTYVYGLAVAMTALDIPRMMILWWGMGLLLAAYRANVPSLSRTQAPASS